MRQFSGFLNELVNQFLNFSEGPRIAVDMRRLSYERNRLRKIDGQRGAVANLP
jgi:hypothetical protein